jgi:hypothetical protein
MKATAINAIPYPEDSDAPNGPQQIKELATLLDVLKWGSRNLKPTLVLKSATKALELTTSYQDVTGAVLEITPAVASVLKVTIIADLTVLGPGGSAQASIKVDSETEDAAVAHLDNDTAASLRVTASQIYVVTLSAAAHTIKMRAKKVGGTATANTAQTRIMGELYAS